MGKRARAWTPDVYDMAQNHQDTDGEGETISAARRVQPTPMARTSGRFSRAGKVSLPPVPDNSADSTDGVDLAAAPAPSRAVPRQSDNSALLGLIMGALVGAGLTLLSTPASGRELRSRVQRGTQTVAQKMPNTEGLGTQSPAAGEPDR